VNLNRFVFVDLPIQKLNRSYHVQLSSKSQKVNAILFSAPIIFGVAKFTSIPNSFIRVAHCEEPQKRNVTELKSFFSIFFSFFFQ